ncbi:hypothetical protein RhiirC2_804767 [Rhizophagus irregularis]|uniref:Uncharacterized protein n=1 Tax=Rhizophagus irregularis TaxID=588596 RepID=A0A2N1KWV8_9GLOM|nr:hypothetical protein RhiirC2_804767 [Rhizophagus irregularis]
MKERRYDLYGDQLRDKWLMVANNTKHKCDQILKDLLSQEKHLQLNQEDTQQLILWNRNTQVKIS